MLREIRFAVKFEFDTTYRLVVFLKADGICFRAVKNISDYAPALLSILMGRPACDRSDIGVSAHFEHILCIALLPPAQDEPVGIKSRVSERCDLRLEQAEYIRYEKTVCNSMVEAHAHGHHESAVLLAVPAPVYYRREMQIPVRKFDVKRVVRKPRYV